MSVTKPVAASLGFPRIGVRRELKFALESFWAGKSGAGELLDTAEHLRRKTWLLQRNKGIDVIPSNDFSLYDHVLDTAVMVGAIPPDYGWTGGDVPLDIYFALARGAQTTGDTAGCGHPGHGRDVRALEMTKWFDTNYHYLVPELARDQTFALSTTKPVDHFNEAKALGIETRPVILGPVTFLKLSKARDGDFSAITLLPRLIPVYAELLVRLRNAGAAWVQVDEPALALDLTEGERAAFVEAYDAIARAVPDVKLMLASYFGDPGDNLDTALNLPVAGLHLDLVRAPDALGDVLAKVPADLVLSLGVIDGRNIWRADLAALMERLRPVIAARGADRVQIAPSCSLLHVPIDVALETELDAELKSWLSFAVQKLDELSALSRGLGGEDIAAALAASDDARAGRRRSARVHNKAVAARLVRVTEADRNRRNGFSERIALQREKLRLPQFPTTTIGSFPQTGDVRKARAAFNRGELDRVAYDAFLQAETEKTIRFQEEIGLDVLVHGEFERNDMVQYFGEKLSGFAFTKHGWVQSYGSRYVRPPVIFGDVSRPQPMTVNWWQFAQSKTEKPVKGMLTGPVTILNWSFVRDDIPRAETCRQIALAIRDEVQDLERAGAAIIQIDEAALREGLPLRQSQWKTYLDWAIDAFRLAASGVSDATQIHTHMCYSEFNDIIAAIAAMDADVISIETSRSRMELLDAFTAFDYPSEIGPGVYDIHAPRIPATSEITDLLSLARERLDDRQIWINPDCGLKTRGWDEVRPALTNMVAAAKALRG
ncbi:5-methyltetrahydropteroyltriglutamate--homocysteine S-methyltransferase [Martelella lutilitoris]|uniref:5-methyltetrahydropteroyltriglutamate--homocysteine methyltransferase n=1 Tax=Martelella lutilitoris TaxID=2583532 RepID=A0A5C4JUB8_9HYPH|nr:5-methyltetrahydropteroyltriglutamate--homocysteine S-methyltransferase [Martelella lutilitoris]TNB48741.1 5-methyltetrahydropteroyltriglutamate--homocysteine S-methyltransferase [Martelella lutilitoris]